MPPTFIWLFVIVGTSAAIAQDIAPLGESASSLEPVEHSTTSSQIHGNNTEQMNGVSSWKGEPNANRIEERGTGIIDERDPEGSTLVAEQAIPLRNAPPTGIIFPKKGAEIGQIEPGSVWTVLSQRTYYTLGGRNTWVQIAPHQGNLELNSTTGWAYYGGGKESPNFNILVRPSSYFVPGGEDFVDW